MNVEVLLCQVDIELDPRSLKLRLSWQPADEGGADDDHSERLRHCSTPRIVDGGEPTAGSFRAARLYHQPKGTEGPASVVRAAILLRQRTAGKGQEPFKIGRRTVTTRDHQALGRPRRAHVVTRKL